MASAPTSPPMLPVVVLLVTKATFGLRSKVAFTLWAIVIATVQVAAVPVQAPVQPVKVDSFEKGVVDAVAVRMTEVS